MSSLPKTLIFTVTEEATKEVRYLSFTGPQSLLRFGAEEGVFSVTTKFAVEPADNGLVHIRSCYDNHYWVRASTTMAWLNASAPDPVTDATDEGCTLFRPQMGTGNLWVSFVHVRSNLNVVVRPASDPYAYNLGVYQSAPTQFSYINYASLVKIPRYVMFKGDNDMYLYIMRDNVLRAYPYQLYELSSPTDPSVGYEIFVTRSGDIRVKSRAYGTFWWRFEDEWPEIFGILVYANFPADDADPSDPRTIFQVVPSSDGGSTSRVALRSLSNPDSMCKRHDVEGRAPDNRLYLDIPPTDVKLPENYNITIVSLSDPSKSRVTVTEFRHYHRVLKDTTSPQSSVFENESDQDVQNQITIPHDDRTSMIYAFTNTVTHGQLASAHFFSQMPYLNEQAQLVIPDEVVSLLGSKSWGQTYVYGVNVDIDSSLPFVNVPAKTRVTAALVTKTATCEIPFSYEMSEQFYAGGEDTYNLYDGVFTGQYTYAYEAKILKSEPL